ncbi:MAG: DNA topoisomerase III [Verrucomicrobia bacterium]|nr:DNA topoisomerase III [Verrucomicrobiota bacterium]
MGKLLVIAEKPSVASDIAKALGRFDKEKDYFENEEMVISSAVGHLVEIAAPDDYEVKRGKWSLGNLPVLPPHFDLKAIEKTEPRLKLLGKLAKRKDVDGIVNACDAGREGELIFRYIVDYLKVNKPTRRLWLQSMTPSAIRDGFQKLRSEQEMQPLADAAISRSESDWLVGINGTRAMTAFNSKSGGFHLTTVGRVQTPTLTIVVEREEKIKSHIPRTYWEVFATFEGAKGDYVGRWFDESFKKSEEGGDSEAKAERFWEKNSAADIADKCVNKPGIVEEKTKPSKQASPLLYDLTSLQREANSRFGIAAANTLKIAQALYERHKVLTYPRTDSRALPEDYVGTVKKTMEMLSGKDGSAKGSMGHGGMDNYGKFAEEILENHWVAPNKRIFNNAKVSDHFAIIPTTMAPKKLSEPEQKIYDMVVRRFLAVFYPSAEFMVTTRITRVENEPFKTEGKVMVNPGWLKVYGKDRTAAAVSADSSQSVSGDKELPPVSQGEKVHTRELEIVESVTKPPPRYNEATLLSAMEGAGKFVDDEELREAMSAKGLGTPATRAAIIEGLLREKYLLRDQKELIPTAKAFSLVFLLRALKIPGLSSPEMTGNWEYQLKQMESGQLQRSQFMEQIYSMTREIVEKTRQYESDTVPGDFGTLKNPCPKCGGEIRENYKRFQCQSCDFGTYKILSGRQLEIHEMEDLVTKRSVGPIEGFRSRLGKEFSAVLKIDEDFKVVFDFGKDEKKESADDEIDFSGRSSLGNCPKCGSFVYELDRAYVCMKATGKEKTCDFRTSKVILDQPVTSEQMVKLLNEKKTDLLHKFISKKTKRAFSAHLVLTEKGDISFEFAPRAPKTKKAVKVTAES